MNIKKIFSLTLFFSFILFSNLAQAGTNKKINIVSTLFAQYDFAKNIGGDKVDVKLILPPGVEPHSYEPSPKDIIEMKKADILLYTGDTMEPWVASLKKTLSNEANKDKVKIINLSENINFENGEEHHHHEGEHKHSHDETHHKHHHSHKGECCGHHHEEEHKHSHEESDHKHHHHEEEHEHSHDETHEHHHYGVDPHIWLDFDKVIIMVNNIKNSLISIDKENKNFYEENANNYIEKIKKLDKKYTEEISKFEIKTIYTGGHFAFGHLTKKYGLNYKSPYKGFSPNAEPSPRNIAKIIKELKEKNIKAIYYEELVNPKVAKILANEAGVKMLLLNGLHNVSKNDLENKKSYIEFMEENLKNLKQGLKNE